ncbi:hypothetical protein H920_04786 [Fukomys damarensis]|uniref:Uncharacterized protein n=1 Tax=Fukomys damarensis TaxID=885580 RepID=A0A091DRT6_FUKDA|nr:hypothetical protein H920_04786 [Fukomys damarensis]
MMSLVALSTVAVTESVGLDVDGTDTEELIKERKEEVTTEEPAELQSEQQKVLVEEHPTEEEEDRKEVSSDLIKSITEKWNEYQDLFEKHHPNIAEMQSIESNEQQHGLSLPEGYVVQA